MNVFKAVARILSELLDGPPAEWAFVLNPGDPGLLRSLAQLSAEQASAIPAGGGGSIAAHVDHLRYGMELVNRWSRGENPFADADYSASWRRTTVTTEEWAERVAGLKREAQAWSEALQREREVEETELTGIVSTVAHLAYHTGAIRQIDRSARGPAAKD